jgi:hypothetical protein
MMIIKYELRIPLDPSPHFSRTAQHSTLNGGNPGALKTGYGILTGTECLTMVQMKKYAELFAKGKPIQPHLLLSQDFWHIHI